MLALLGRTLDSVVTAAAQPVLAKLAPVPAPGAALALGVGNLGEELVACDDRDRGAHEGLGEVDAGRGERLEGVGGHGERRACRL